MIDRVRYVVVEAVKWVVTIALLISYFVFAVPVEKGPTMWARLNGASSPQAVKDCKK